MDSNEDGNICFKTLLLVFQEELNVVQAAFILNCFGGNVGQLEYNQIPNFRCCQLVDELYELHRQSRASRTKRAES